MGGRWLQRHLRHLPPHRRSAGRPVRPAKDFHGRRRRLHCGVADLRLCADDFGSYRRPGLGGCRRGASHARVAGHHPRRLARREGARPCPRHLGQLQRHRLRPGADHRRRVDRAFWLAEHVPDRRSARCRGSRPRLRRDHRIIGSEKSSLRPQCPTARRGRTGRRHFGGDRGASLAVDRRRHRRGCGIGFHFLHQSRKAAWRSCPGSLSDVPAARIQRRDRGHGCDDFRMYGTIFLVPMLWQSTGRLDSIAAGLALLPMSVVFVLYRPGPAS